MTVSSRQHVPCCVVVPGGRQPGCVPRPCIACGSKKSRHSAALPLRNACCLSCRIFVRSFPPQETLCRALQMIGTPGALLRKPGRFPWSRRCIRPARPCKKNGRLSRACAARIVCRFYAGHTVCFPFAGQKGRLSQDFFRLSIASARLLYSALGSIGLAMWPSIPAARHF